MAEATTSEVRLDAHSIEPIPEQDKDSTGPQQMWIWAGANIAPINWILGALGIVLGPGLVETVLIVVLGNLIGCAIFAAMTEMGHKTGVNQMVLSRSAFGRRGGYLSSWMQFLMTMGWIGVNTYFPVLLAVAILGHFGVKDTFAVKFTVVTVIMVIQVGIGVYGFYLIRTFEKYTVPVTLAIFALMSILAWSRPGVVDWSLSTKLTGAAYFSALAAVSAGIRASRFALGLLAGVVGYAVTLYFLRAPSFAQSFDNWMVGLVLWMSPWAGVVLADFYLLRKQRIDVDQLYADPERSAYGDVNWVGIAAFIIGLVAGWMLEFGLVTPLQGFVSKNLLSGADLSWLVGLVVAGGIYLVGMRGRALAPAPETERAAPPTVAGS